MNSTNTSIELCVYYTVQTHDSCLWIMYKSTNLWNAYGKWRRRRRRVKKCGEAYEHENEHEQLDKYIYFGKYLHCNRYSYNKQMHNIDTSCEEHNYACSQIHSFGWLVGVCAFRTAHGERMNIGKRMEFSFSYLFKNRLQKRKKSNA